MGIWLGVVVVFRANQKLLVYISKNRNEIQERPYNDDSTASRSLCEVKHRLAQLVLRWGTTLES